MALRMKSMQLMSHSSPAVDFTVHTQLQDAADEPSLHSNSDAFESSPMILTVPSTKLTGPIQG